MLPCYTQNRDSRCKTGYKRAELDAIPVKVNGTIHLKFENNPLRRIIIFVFICNGSNKSFNIVEGSLEKYFHLARRFRPGANNSVVGNPCFIQGIYGG